MTCTVVKKRYDSLKAAECWLTLRLRTLGHFVRRMSNDIQNTMIEIKAIVGQDMIK